MSFSGLVFSQPGRLWWLCALPLFFLLFAAMLHWTRVRLDRFGQRTLISRITPENSIPKQYLKFGFLMAAYVFLVASLARPALNYRRQIQQPVDIYLVVDVSSSMLARDVSPNRLEAGKRLITSLVTALPNARFGLIPFAGQSIVEVPLTKDKQTVLLFLDQLGPGSIPLQGTLIGPALELASAGFSSAAGRTKIILLVTDGENFGQGALQAASSVRAHDQSLIVCGLGGTSGSPIPETLGSRSSYKKDRTGKVIMTSMHRQFLDSLAQASHGSALELNQTFGGDMVLAKVQELVRARRSVPMEEVHTIDFTAGLGTALVLLLLEFLLSERRGWLFARLRSSRNALTLASLLTVFSLPVSAQRLLLNARKGNAAYARGEYEKAGELYKKSLNASSGERIRFNFASTLYQQEDYPSAATLFFALSRNAGPLIRQQAYYDLGNCYCMEHDYPAAIGAYVQSLRSNSGDKDALYNLAYARAMLSKKIPPPPPPPPPIQRLQKKRIQLDAAKQPAPLPALLQKSRGNPETQKGRMRQDW